MATTTADMNSTAEASGLEANEFEANVDATVSETSVADPVYESARDFVQAHIANAQAEKQKDEKEKDGEESSDEDSEDSEDSGCDEGYGIYGYVNRLLRDGHVEDAARVVAAVADGLHR
jgi:ribosomal protein L12E/L44/L45/RPP1/RPP2